MKLVLLLISSFSDTDFSLSQTSYLKRPLSAARRPPNVLAVVLGRCGTVKTCRSLSAGILVMSPSTALRCERCYRIPSGGKSHSLCCLHLCFNCLLLKCSSLSLVILVSAHPLWQSVSCRVKIVTRAFEGKQQESPAVAVTAQGH